LPLTRRAWVYYNASPSGDVYASRGVDVVHRDPFPLLHRDTCVAYILWEPPHVVAGCGLVLVSWVAVGQAQHLVIGLDNKIDMTMRESRSPAAWEGCRGHRGHRPSGKRLVSWAPCP